MKISDFIEIVKITAWPLTIILIISKFEEEIKNLINDIRLSISFGDKKLEVSHDKTEELKQGQVNVSDTSEIDKLKDENKKHSDIEKRLLELQENTAKTKDAFFLGFHFEKTYRLIFGSQLVIVNQLYQHGTISDALIQSIYRRTMWFNNYPYTSYVGFLVNSGLISQIDTSGNYSILPIGKGFIEYLNSNNMPLIKQPY